jgi:hypothetical protein
MEKRMPRFILAVALSIVLTGCATTGGNGVVDNRQEALATARQIGCDTRPLSHTVTSPGIEVFRFQCAAGREVTLTCRNGSCGGE